MNPSNAFYSKGANPLHQAISSFFEGTSELPELNIENELEDLWEEAQAKTGFEELEKEWNNDMNDLWEAQRPMTVHEFCEMWQEMWPMEEFKAEYLFETQNHYIGDNNIRNIVAQTMDKGDICASILALEALVIQNPESADAWVLLGKLNAENDEDNRAVAALNKAYNIDNYNLDAILALGINLINGKQEEEALQMLLKWIENNPHYMHLSSTNTVLHEKVIDLFMQASNLHSEDSALFQVLGSLHFMNKEYDLAVSAFSNAVEKDLNNYYCWNRLGAALAHKGDNLNAIHAYQKALEIRPAYVRAWANLGIAHANINDMVSAARFYLCALSFNPKAAHIWNYLFTSFTCMSKFYLGRFDLLEKLKKFQVDLFEEEFQFYSIKNLVMGNDNEWTNEYVFDNN